MAQLDDSAKVIPARLSFLSIYNPTLATSDDNFKDQVLFYYSRIAHERRKSNKNEPGAEQTLQEDENEKLRQIGLAQGMVHFARNFADGSKIDNVETEKSRIVTHELEPDWWIIASVDLTQIPITSTPASSKSSATTGTGPTVEYSSREVSPPALLIQQLLRTHSIFQLHNGPTLDGLFRHLPRARFMSMLDRYWTRFALNWDVLLHGMPVVEVFGGMHLSAGGELGVGVGEEEWGAGEREVLEDFGKRTEGLVDLLVARFGGPAEESNEDKGKVKTEKGTEPWMGIGEKPISSDGVIFSGLGTLSKSAMRDVSSWVQTIYSQGELAYAVKESPSSNRRKRRTRTPRTTSSSKPDYGNQEPPPGIPRPIVAAADRSLEAATARAENKQQARPQSKPPKSKPPPPTQEQEMWKKYLFLGYGTAWGVSGHDSPPPEQPVSAIQARINAHIARENAGHFLIGLQGDPDTDNDSESDEEGSNQRIVIRTVHVTLSDPNNTEFKPETPIPASSPQVTRSTSQFSTTSAVISTASRSTRLRILIYVHRPFIYALLFSPSTPTLMLPSFYTNMHTFLAPLRALLLRRTGPASAALRRHHRDEDSRSKDPTAERTYEVVYDSKTLAVCADVPSIGEARVARGDALNLHSAAMEVVASTRNDEVERRVKTARGWWIGWARVLDDAEEKADEEQDDQDQPAKDEQPRGREVLLFRRAREGEGKGKGRGVSGWGLRGSGESRLEGADMGIGFDARKYVEGIMGFGR